MTFDDYYKKLKESLGALYETGEAAAIAGLVLEKFTGKRLKPFSTEMMPEADTTKLLGYQQELLTGKPVQYLLGEAWFLERKYAVNESVLIPRPETEELVMLAADILKGKRFQQQPIKILDIGTGSGCIAISLALASGNYAVTGIDVSEKALEVARQNSQLLSAGVNWRQADFLDPESWKAFADYPVIVSNPPYIPLAEKAILDKNVTDWEPHLALFTPDNDPFVFYHAMASFCRKYPLKERILFIEGHQDYMNSLQNIFEGVFQMVEIRKDINDNERMLVGYN